MSGRTLNNVVNEQTVALNALIYGYAGHSLVTPHAAIQQVWWTEERINEKVTAEFVTSRMRPNERQWLQKQVGFGDLTDDTYIDWILERARRLFLVLAEVGESEKIFAVVDRSWDDDDLPLQMEDIEKLELTNRRDDQANSRFYHTQFTFLLRELDEGVHIDYAPNEVLPLEYVMSLPPAVTLQHWSRVHRPKNPSIVYVRRKFPLGDKESPTCFESDYIMDVESSRMVEHDHIAPLWASYTLGGSGYTLTNFVGQHTLKSFIDHRKPAQYQKLPKPGRRHLILNWLHCLADAVASLHRMGFCHSSIRPSNILIDEHNSIAFSDIGSLETFQKDKKPDAMEMYVYGAPEANTPHPLIDPDAPAPPPKDGKVRQPSIMSKSSGGSSNSSGSRQKLHKVPTNELSGFNFGFKKTKPKPKPRSRMLETEKADVFSLGCVFLDLLTFMLKRKAHDFVKQRSSKQKVNMGGKNSRTDASFHANLDRVEVWIQTIEDAAIEHDDIDYKAVPHILNLVRGMLNRAPGIRPSARDVRDRLHDILLHYTSMTRLHCSVHRDDEVGVATSSTSDSDRTSSMSSFRSSSLSVSTMTTDSDTLHSASSTMRGVSSILNSYADRSTLDDISEFDDGDSMRTIGKAIDAPIAIRVEPKDTADSDSSMSPTSPQTRSPSDASGGRRFKPWNKPFLMLP